MKNDRWKFLESVRFWKVVAAGVALALFDAQVISSQLTTLITTILLGSAAIRTIDRLGEKIGSK